jgi:hypothetical protein
VRTRSTKTVSALPMSISEKAPTTRNKKAKRCAHALIGVVRRETDPEGFFTTPLGPLAAGPRVAGRMRESSYSIAI